MVPDQKEKTTKKDVAPVLVTGARGFIGRAVCELLQRDGYRLVGLDLAPLADSPIDSISTSSHRPRYVQCDISDAAQLHRVFEAERIERIVHLAAVLPTVAQREPLRATQVNLWGSFNLLEMARQFSVQRFVFGSSLSVYGTYPPTERVAETDRTAPEDLYGAAKLYVEQLGAAYRSRYGLQFFALRMGRVIGPGARSTTSAWRSEIFEKLLSTQPTEIRLPYLGTEQTLVIHVEDVAQMLVRLLTAPDPKHLAYNACCESVGVSALKRELESLNPNLQLRLGAEEALLNPRLLDSSRFETEFKFCPPPIFERLRRAAGG